MRFPMLGKLQFSLVAMALGLSACATPDMITQEPVLPSARLTQNALFELPPPAAKLDVAVYNFEDLTGQFKPAEGFQNLSKAVSQGGASILVKALQDAGNRSWFTVIERSSLNNLLQERKIITQMRKQYLNETEVNSKFLPPMRFAGIIMEGGIVGYDTNTLTGGAGARLLGIGASAEYRQDTISVDLRAVSVKTGEVLASTVVHKTLISAGISGSSFSYIDVDKILEIEAGVSTNEPGLIALTKAIEKAVHSLIVEGADLGIWAFKNESQALALINQHREANGRSPRPVSQPRQTEIAQQVKTAVPAPAAQQPTAPPSVRKAASPAKPQAPRSAKPRQTAVTPAARPTPPAAQTPRANQVRTRTSVQNGSRVTLRKAVQQSPPAPVAAQPATPAGGARNQAKAAPAPQQPIVPRTLSSVLDDVETAEKQAQPATRNAATAKQPAQAAENANKPVDVFMEVIVNGRTIENSPPGPTPVYTTVSP